MSKREIIKAIIEHAELPERMGITEDFWPETVEYHWPEQGIGRDIDPIEHFDLDIVDLMAYWQGGRFKDEAFVDSCRVLTQDEETVTFTNGWGTTLRTWKRKNGAPEHIAFDMTTPEIWRRKYREPLLHLDTSRFDDIEGLKARYGKYTGAGYFTMYNSCFVFERMRASMGDVRMLEACLLEPEWVHDFCSVYADFTIRHVEYVFREVGVPDGYTIYDDMAYAKSSFISPEAYRELIVPYLRRFTDFLHGYGVYVIMHCCGNFEPQMENILDAGVDCIQPIEAKAGMKLADLGKRFGDRIAFMGNIDIRALETNNRAAVEAEIAPKLRMVRERRIPYIFHTDHSVSPGVSVSTYEYALELFRQHCRY